ncbi:MAG: family protein rssA [Hyphomicrobiales bacterium]|nr:family protein rssA [Hyphomicrobiales bacterium]
MNLFGTKTMDQARETGGGQPAPHRPHRGVRIGVALGAGAARGWAHIGVLRELEACGLVPEVVAGASIGAVVGGCWAGGALDDLEDFARSLTKRRVFSLLDLSFSGAGLIAGNKLRQRLEKALGDQRVEDLKTTFAAVATEMGAGHEIWLTKGNLVEALRASYALPGIFEPVRVGKRWLFDGALVNPVPITVCRALGAELVIAVNLVAETRWRATVISDEASLDETLVGLEAQAVNAGAAPPSGFLPNLRGRRGLFRGSSETVNAAPGVAATMVDAFNITQDRIARSRLAGDPPDASINAKLGRIGLFDFHRADEMIAIGRESVRRAMADIEEQIALLAP